MAVLAWIGNILLFYLDICSP